jgi:hypothetical protein
VSDICRVFDCLPDEAERQDAETVDLVLEYRGYERAVEVYRQGKAGRDTFKEHPVLLELLAELFRAQLGDHPNWGAVIDQRMSTMRAPGATEEDEN